MMPASTLNQSDCTDLTRILLVDDHPIVRRGLAMLISFEPNLSICGEANGLSQAMRAFHESKPDLVIADLTLENGSGISLVKELVAQSPGIKVLICSMHDEQLYAERALRAGAKGYVNKEVATIELTTAIRRILSGGVHLSPRMTDRMISQRSGNTRPETNGTSFQALSDRELEVFEQIGHGATTRQVAHKLHLSPKTIETYRENIKTKLHLTNSAELTRQAIKWVLEGH